MLYNNDFGSKMYERLAELEEKLLKSEAERKLLEAKFQFMADSYKNEEERRMNNLREKYAEFMEDCKERSRRNDDILKSLQKVENGANAVYAKTERLKQLRSHYDAYLSRANPLWRHPDVLQLQAPDTAQRLPWIREPRPNVPVTRPALLLPGGGAVMLPVDESGMTVPLVAPHLDSPIRFADDDVRKLRLSESIASAKDAKIISTLGEAGQRMMKELKLIEGSHFYSSRVQPVQRPVYYQSYHLPVYIPPLYAPTAICAPPPIPLPLYPSTADYTTDIIASTKHSHSPKTDSKPDTNLVGLHKTEKHSTNIDDRRIGKLEKSRDSFEIECLAADGNNVDEENDANLSDDEVLDVALGRSQSPFQTDNPIAAVKSEWATPHESHRMYSENPSFREHETIYKGDNFEKMNAGKNIPLAQIAHQKSIDELKAMLSFDEEVADVPTEAQHYVEPDGGYPIDEDVPEEFTEQNYSEPNYDPRFQRNVSRNVILEEDEEEEEENVAVVTAKEDEWFGPQERNTYSSSPDNRMDYPVPAISMGKHESPKSPQQYAQQFKAINRSPSQANVVREHVSPPQIQRQQSRAAVQREASPPLPQPQSQSIQRQPSRVTVVKKAPPEEERDPISVPENAFPYERHENLPQCQTIQSNEFPDMSDLHRDLQVTSDNYDRSEHQQPGEFDGNPVYDPNYVTVDEQPQFDQSHLDTYENQQHYEESHQIDQYQDQYQHSTLPADDYYRNNEAELYTHPDQEAIGNYQPNEPMHDYYPQQPENDNPYPEQELSSYPQNDFYQTDMNHPQYAKQYGPYEDEQQQQMRYTADGDQELYVEQPMYAQYEPDLQPEQTSEQVISGRAPIAENVTGNAPRSSILNQLMDSESESYQVDPAVSAPDDSDFDFSIGKS